MKKHSTKKTVKSPPKKSDNISEGYDSDTETGTFSAWLRSGEGTELMKIFVIANSIIVFLTMSWPHLKEMFETIYTMITELQI